MEFLFRGSGTHAAYSMALASDKSIYLCGRNELLRLSNDCQRGPTFAGGVADGYVAHISPNGNSCYTALYGT